MEEKHKKICMFVLNPCTNDARVLKEAETLGKVGYKVYIIAVLTEAVTQEIENREYFTIFRVKPISLATYVKQQYYKIVKGNNVFDGKKMTYASSEKLFQFRLRDHATRGIKHFLKGLLHKFSRSTSFISYWLKAGKYAVSIRADVYHAHDLNTMLFAYLAARSNGSKLVYDSHELYTERNTFFRNKNITKWLTRKFEGFVITKADAVITVNRSIAKELANMYRISIPSVVMNCPDTSSGGSSSLLREKIGAKGNQKIILYLGFITFNRGLEETITALQQIHNGVLVLMGYGKPDYISSLQEEILRLGVKDKVYFVPAVSRHEVIKVAASADISIVPIQNACKSYYYCSPNKLFESMMAGLPVAASNFPEIRRVVEEADCGLLFDSSKPEDIARVLNNMIGDPEMCQRMKNNALMHAHKYSWEEESKKLLSIYEELLSG